MGKIDHGLFAGNRQLDTDWQRYAVIAVIVKIINKAVTAVRNCRNCRAHELFRIVGQPGKHGKQAVHAVFVDKRQKPRLTPVQGGGLGPQVALSFDRVPNPAEKVLKKRFIEHPAPVEKGRRDKNTLVYQV